MNYALIVAGGQGTRIGGIIPKQFLELDEKPILYYTIKKFLDYNATLMIILVLPKEWVEPSIFLNRYFPENTNILLVEGGETRFHSVQNGLQYIEGDGLVYIHDGVRPFVSKEVLKNCAEACLNYGNAIPCVDVQESIRELFDKENKSVVRTNYKLIQTPQTFLIPLIKNAYEEFGNSSFTDDASIFEKAGNKIHLVNGNIENIKITSPQDLATATYILNKEKEVL